MSEFRAIGLSYKKTPIELREQVSFESENGAADLLLKLKETFGIEEGLVLSTCNRTEIYYSCAAEIDDDIIRLISSLKGLSPKDLRSHFFSYEKASAIRQLFRVSLGIESKVLGDIQIASQVKKAYQTSADLNLAGPFLHRLMHTIFYAHKRVVQETRLQDGNASVASVAADLVASFLPRIEKPKVALIGLGEIGQHVLENLNRDTLQLTLINRSMEKATHFAEKVGAEVRPLSSLEESIAENDIIITAVTSDEAIISIDQLPSEASQKLFIDLSVPRNIDPSVGSLAGISLYNIDQINERSHKAMDIRRKAVPDAEQIIEEAITSLKTWQDEMEVSPTIKKLKQTLDSIRREELARHTHLNDKEIQLLEVVTKNMLQKVIKLPVLQLKAACKRGEAETLVGVLNDLFNLEQVEENK